MIAFLSWQFGLSELANQNTPNSAEQYKIIYPYIAGVIITVVPFLINSYIDEQVNDEVKTQIVKTRGQIEISETSDGIRAQQELEFIVLCARTKQEYALDKSVIKQNDFNQHNLSLLDPLINQDALLPVVRQKIKEINSSRHLFDISQDERGRELAVVSLLKRNTKEDEFALLLARSAVYKEFGISTSTDTNPEHPLPNTICKELYIFIRGWLVYSLQKGRYMPVKALKMSHPRQKNRYKSALARIYLDVIHREKAKAYLPSEPEDIILVQDVIETHLKWLISRL
jgi:hypothetical protein